MTIHSDPVMASFKEFAENKLYDLASMYGTVDPLTGETIVPYGELPDKLLSEIKLNMDKKITRQDNFKRYCIYHGTRLSTFRN